jgi:hypothetical protein
MQVDLPDLGMLGSVHFAFDLLASQRPASSPCRLRNDPPCRHAAHSLDREDPPRAEALDCAGHIQGTVSSPGCLPAHRRIGGCVGAHRRGGRFPGQDIRGLADSFVTDDEIAKSVSVLPTMIGSHSCTALARVCILPSAAMPAARDGTLPRLPVSSWFSINPAVMFVTLDHET